MKTRIWILAVLIPVFSFSAEKAELSGQELAAEIRQLAPEKNSEITGLIQIRKNKNRQELTVLCQIRIVPEGWETTYQSGAADGILPERLVIHRGTNGQNTYYHGVGTNKNDVARVRKLAIEETSRPFASSDFWLMDLGLEFLHWKEQKRLDGEMRLGRPCFVLESRSEKSYDGLVRVKSWIDKETGGLLVAEGFDNQNQLIKDFSLGGSSFKKVNGEWKLEEMKIRSPQKQSQTVLKFHLDP